MTDTIDYSALDIPQFNEAIFFTRSDWTPTPPGAADHFIEVAADVRLGARSYPATGPIGTVIYFHGNGEVASDYDNIAELYHEQSLSLFVADFRGYGRSNGSPSFTTMASDAHKVLDYVKNLTGKGKEAPLFIMGRSLGSHSAVELAARRPGDLKGFILESGFAHVSRLARRLGVAASAPALDGIEQAMNARVKGITLPVLIIHGEEDTLVPPQNAYSFYKMVGSPDKTLLTIPGAGHNDIMNVGMEDYFGAIGKFARRLASH